MSKRYKLLKDLPGIKEGTVFELAEPALYQATNDSEGVFTINEETIEKYYQWFEEIHQPKEDKPEWEIVAYHETHGHTPYIDGVGYKIKSVKRLSDGIVFSVGDEVEYGSVSLYGKDMRANKCKIEKFYTMGVCGKDEMWVSGDNERFNFPLLALPKSKPKEELKEPERKVVELISGNNGNDSTVVTITSKTKIPVDKFPAIKQAIEQVLNDGGKKELVKQLSQSHYVNMRGEKCYDQEQVNKMMEDAAKPKSFIIKNKIVWRT